MNLDDARRLALSLPGTREAPHFDLTSFRIGTKVFATAPPDGDHVRVFVDEDEVRACVEEDPEVFGELRWGGRIAAVRVALGAVEPDRLAELLEESWRRKATKRLIAELDGAARDPRIAPPYEAR